MHRTQREWTVEDLARRVGVSPVTVRKVERGDPTVALGTAFEAAVLVGVELFTDDRARLAAEERRVEAFLTLLPSRVRQAPVDDDF